MEAAKPIKGINQGIGLKIQIVLDNRSTPPPKAPAGPPLPVILNNPTPQIVWPQSRLELGVGEWEWEWEWKPTPYNK